MLVPLRPIARLGRTILVIDDDPVNRTMIRATLEQAGHDVQEADDGESGLAAFESHRPDLVILDILMRNMGGFEACRALRALPHGEHIPILMITGLDDVDSITSAYDAGATDFATKPLNYLLLRHRVNYLLRSSGMAAELRQSEERLSTAQRLAKLGHWEWHIGADRLWVSKELYSILGGATSHPYKALKHFVAMTHPEDREHVKETMHTALRNQTGYRLEHRIILADGTLKAIEQNVRTLEDEDSDSTRVLGIVRDVTEHWQVQNEVLQLSYFDQVTGLPNRHSLLDRLNHLTQACEPNGARVVALWINLDHFQRVNNTLGHAAGNTLLRKMAERIEQGMTHAYAQGIIPCDAGHLQRHVVGHVDSDNFVVILPCDGTVDCATPTAEAIQASISHPIGVDEQELIMTASVGVGVYPDDCEDGDTLLRNAGAALQRAKRNGPKQLQFFDSSWSEQARRRLSLETDLRRAIDNDQLVLHYQPKISLQEDQVEGMEALVRWLHPTKGMVSPADFIPIAEQCGLIVPLGEWVLRRSLEQLVEWNASGLKPLKVSVNLSGAQLQQDGFSATVESILKETGANPKQVELELTEGLLMEDTERNIQVLKELTGLGLELSIDDFGTGYSSLSYLTRFPLSALKIDSSFVQDLSTNRGNTAIVSATIALAHSLRLRVIAEGAEQRPEVDFLRGLGCDAIQGYYFSKPLPADEFAPWVRAFDQGQERKAA